jgi:DNA primase
MFDFSKIQSEDSYITKDFVLSRLSDQQIIEYYLNVKLAYSNLISSPFREDKNPSFGIKYNEAGKFIAKDFSTNETFDCFSIVQKLYNCNFQEALRIISNDFNLINTTKSSCVSGYRVTESTSGLSKLKNKKNVITIEKQPFTKVDLDYWSQYGIDEDTLKLFNIKSCKYVWLNGSLCRIYNSKNPVYAYQFNKTYKIYCPLTKNKKTKWLFSGSQNDIEGYDILVTNCFTSAVDKYEKSCFDTLIITKSLKDVMCLYKLGYQAISLQGETNPFTFELYLKLKNLGFKNFYTFYDNDKAGIEGTNEIVSAFPDFIPLFIPEEYGAKDISDYIAKFGLREAQSLIDSLL